MFADRKEGDSRKEDLADAGIHLSKQNNLQASWIRKRRMLLFASCYGSISMSASGATERSLWREHTKWIQTEFSSAERNPSESKHLGPCHWSINLVFDVS